MNKVSLIGGFTSFWEWDKAPSAEHRWANVNLMVEDPYPGSTSSMVTVPVRVSANLWTAIKEVTVPLAHGMVISVTGHMANLPTGDPARGSAPMVMAETFRVIAPSTHAKKFDRVLAAWESEQATATTRAALIQRRLDEANMRAVNERMAAQTSSNNERMALNAKNKAEAELVAAQAEAKRLAQELQYERLINGAVSPAS